MAKKTKTTNAIEILHRRHYTGKPTRIAALTKARTNDSVARQLVALRHNYSSS